MTADQGRNLSKFASDIGTVAERELQPFTHERSHNAGVFELETDHQRGLSNQCLSSAAGWQRILPMGRNCPGLSVAMYSGRSVRQERAHYPVMHGGERIETGQCRTF